MCTLSEVLFRSNLPVTMSFFSPYFSIIVNSILIGVSQRHLSLTCLCPCSCPPATSPAASGSYGSCSWPFLAAHPSTPHSHHTQQQQQQYTTSLNTSLPLHELLNNSTHVTQHSVVCGSGSMSPFTTAP